MATRPQFPTETFGTELDEATLAEWREEWDEAMRARELRGPLHFKLTQPHTCGFLVVEESDGGSRTEYLTGEFKVDVFEAPIVGEAYGLTPEDIAHNPFEHVEDLAIMGATDAHVRALCAKQNLREIDVTGQLHNEPAPIDEALTAEEREQADEVEREIAEWQASARPQTGTLTDACLETVPTTVESIHLRDTTITDATLTRVLRTVESLGSLGIQSDRITGEFLKALEHHPEIGNVGVDSEALTGTEIAKSLPTLPECESAQFVGPKVLDGFDAEVISERLPILEDLVINPTTLTQEQHLRLALALPGVTINDVVLSERAIEKAAAKLGIEL